MDRTGQTLIGVLAGLLLATFLFGLIAAWPVMIALSVLHGTWSAVPGFSFLQTFVLLWALDLVCQTLPKR